MITDWKTKNFKISNFLQNNPQIQHAAAAAKSLQSSDSVWPHRRHPTKLPHPWDSPGKNNGMSCHFLLQCMKMKLLNCVQPSATPWTAAFQTPPSMGFSRQEYWSGVPLPSPKSSILHINYQLSSVQSLSRVRLFVTHERQYARPPSPSPTPRVYWNSYPLGQWCYPSISFPVVPFSSHFQSFPEKVSFQMSQFFASGGQSIGVSASASVLPMNIQDWFPLRWTVWISLQSKDSQESSPTPQFKSISSWALSLFHAFLHEISWPTDGTHASYVPCIGRRVLSP